jgi:hypothetical protein
VGGTSVGLLGAVEIVADKTGARGKEKALQASRARPLYLHGLMVAAFATA